MGAKLGEGAYTKIFCERWNLGGKYADDSGSCLTALTAVINKLTSKIDLRLSPERKILLVASESELQGKVVMMVTLDRFNSLI